MKKSLAAFALLSSVAATSAVAKDVKHINKTMDVEQGQSIVLNVPVGSVDVKTCDCNEISLRIEIEASNNSWGFFNKGDVDDAELDIRERRSGLNFEIEQDNTKQNWTVTVPASSALSIELGVGDVDVNDFDNDLDVEVGVGRVSVELQEDNYQDINIESGVGDTSIDGLGGNVREERAVVSSSARYRGEGKYSIKVEMGVGEVDVSKS